MRNVYVDKRDARGRPSTRRAVVDLREIATGTDDRVGVRDPQPGPQVTFLFGNLMDREPELGRELVLEIEECGLPKVKHLRVIARFQAEADPPGTFRRQ